MSGVFRTCPVLRTCLTATLVAALVYLPPARPSAAEAPQDTTGGQASESSLHTSPTQSDETTLQQAQRLMESGRFDAAITLLQAPAADAPGGPLEARRLGTLGIALTMAGAHAEAIEAQHRALASFEAREDPAGASAVMINLGSALSALGDHDGARSQLEQALALKQSHGIEKGIGTIHNNLAELHEADGNLPAARTELEQAVAAHHQLANALGEATARANLARILACLGQFDDAWEQALAAEHLARTHDIELSLRIALAAQATVLMESSRDPAREAASRSARLSQADMLLSQAMDLSQRSQDNERSIRLLEQLSDLRQLQGRMAEALEAIHRSRALEDEQRQHAGRARADLLAARLERERQNHQIEQLRAREAEHAAKLRHQRLGLWALAGLLVLALAFASRLWQRNRVRRQAAEQLNEHNIALSHALARADLERQRAENFALRQRRFLRLASEDLSAPLHLIRTQAERALVEETPEQRRRICATVAQTSADLIWVTEQMLESASHEDPASQSIQAEPVALDKILQTLTDEAAPRALQRDQHLRLECAKVPPRRLERLRLTVALRELIDILLHQNPPRSTLRLGLRDETDGATCISLGIGQARLPDWQDVARGENGGDVTLRLALAWIQHAIQDNGGQITTEHDENGDRIVAIRFPAED